MKIARFATAAGLVLAMAACHARSSGEVRDAGAAVERDFAVGAFRKIAVSGPYEVEVRAGGKPSVHATGGEHFLDQTDVAVEDGTLVIKAKRKNFSWTWSQADKRVRIVVNGAGALEGAAIAGSGGIRVDQAVSPSFKGEVAGSGDLDIAGLDSPEVELSIAGSGSINAAGKARSVAANIAGSGDLDAAKLLATDASVSIAGSGNILAHATGTADISIMGSGDVTLTGGAKCDISKNGSGNVNCS